jgi:hypothetical protein
VQLTLPTPPPFFPSAGAAAPNAIHRIIGPRPNQEHLCISMWIDCGSLVRKREIYTQKSSSEARFFIERAPGADTIAAARESVAASSLARSYPRSFGVAGGERGDESGGATRPFGAAPLGLDGAVSSERHHRAGGRAPGRPAPVSDRHRQAFGLPGPSRGTAGPFGDLRSLARKSSRKGGGTRREESDTAGGPAFRRRSSARGIRLLAQAGCLLTGALPRGGKAGSRVLARARGLRLPRRQGCPPGH